MTKSLRSSATSRSIQAWRFGPDRARGNVRGLPSGVRLRMGMSAVSGIGGSGGISGTGAAEPVQAGVAPSAAGAATAPDEGGVASAASQGMTNRG